MMFTAAAGFHGVFASPCVCPDHETTAAVPVPHRRPLLPPLFYAAGRRVSATPRSKKSSRDARDRMFRGVARST